MTILQLLFGVCLLLNFVAPIMTALAGLVLLGSLRDALIGIAVASVNLVIATYAVIVYGWQNESAGLIGVGTYAVSGSCLIVCVAFVIMTLRYRRASPAKFLRNHI